MPFVLFAIKKSVIGLFLVIFFGMPLCCMEMEEKIQTKRMKNLSIKAKDLKKKLKEKTISPILKDSPTDQTDPAELLQYCIEKGKKDNTNETNKEISTYLVEENLLNKRIYKKDNGERHEYLKILYTPLRLCLLLENSQLARNLILQGAEISNIYDQQMFLKLAITDRLDLLEGDLLKNLLSKNKNLLTKKMFTCELFQSLRTYGGLQFKNTLAVALKEIDKNANV